MTLIMNKMNIQVKETDIPTVKLYKGGGGGGVVTKHSS